MKMGSGTGPCGRCSVAARARVVCEAFVSDWCSLREDLGFAWVSAYVRSISLVARTSELRWLLAGPCRFALPAKALWRGLSEAWVWWWWAVSQGSEVGVGFATSL
jgi:hypothetical protein